MIFGILSGLGAATSQSLSYMGTRHFVQRRAGPASLQLLVLGHGWMAIFAAALLPFVISSGLRWELIGWPLLWATVFNIAGQLCLVTALKQTEASRVSPLLTMKLIFTGTLTSIFGLPIGGNGTWITPWQWLAVGICVLAGVSINFSGGRMKWSALLAIVGGTATFSLSDWNINLLIKGIMAGGTMDGLHASLLAESFSYLAIGAVVLPLLAPLGSKKARDWSDAFPFAIAWFMAMVFLFIAFSSVGILLGSILQCTRGFITILIGAGFMYFGHLHIEPPQTRGVMVRRLAAGLLMFGGITLYVLAGPHAK